MHKASVRVRNNEAAFGKLGSGIPGRRARGLRGLYDVLLCFRFPSFCTRATPTDSRQVLILFEKPRTAPPYDSFEKI